MGSKLACRDANKINRNGFSKYVCEGNVIAFRAPRCEELCRVREKNESSRGDMGRINGSRAIWKNPGSKLSVQLRGSP